MEEEKLYVFVVDASFEVIAESPEEAAEVFEKGMGDLMDIINVEELYEL